MFSILIPSWNNLKYLQLCIESIKKNSVFQHQIIVHLNDGSDGSLEWIMKNGIEYTHTPTNSGVCVALNMAATKAKNDYIVFVNDDMYCLPNWDKHLFDEINKLPNKCFMISSTMIEPNFSNNNAVIVSDYGSSIENFQEEKILKEFEIPLKNDWSGSCWPPNIVHKEYWQLVGGYSIEFTPGMSSDDDFAMKMWQVGCRYFKGIGKSRVYHFQQKSTGRINKNDGAKQFLFKWGITQSFFNKSVIKKGQDYTPMQTSSQWKLSLKEKLKIFYKKKLKY